MVSIHTLCCRYEIFTYLIPYVSMIESFEHRRMILELFEYEYNTSDSREQRQKYYAILPKVVEKLKNVNLVENYESNLTSPPPDNITNTIPCAPAKNEDIISHVPEQNKNNKQTGRCVLL
jgi:hypothetical protein